MLLASKPDPIYIKHILKGEVPMIKVKIIKIGHSKVLPVPKAFKTISTEYEAFLGRDGAITFLPVTLNPFDNKDSIKKYGKFNGDTTCFIDVGFTDKKYEDL
jgi:hypothetical protein